MITSLLPVNLFTVPRVQPKALKRHTATHQGQGQPLYLHLANPTSPHTPQGRNGMSKAADSLILDHQISTSSWMFRFYFIRSSTERRQQDALHYCLLFILYIYLLVLSSLMKPKSLGSLGFCFFPTCVGLVPPTWGWFPSALMLLYISLHGR